MAAASAVVGAAATESWAWVKATLLELLDRDDRGGTPTDLVARTERAVTTDGVSPEAGHRLGDEWAARIEDLISTRPDLVPDLRALVTVAARRGISAAATPPQVTQHVTGSDSAQQAVQGQGVQNISFGHRDDR
jgi:hypothetical protein